MEDILNARFRAPLPEYYARRIIIWLDEEAQFAGQIDALALENARVLAMREGHMFELRRQIELDYAGENLLIYCPLRFERPEDNYLLDVFLYAEEFRADYYSQLFDELHIENSRAMRDYARTIAPFFKSRERRARLAALRTHYETPQQLRDGVLCALCGLKRGGFGDALRMVIADADGALLAEIEKQCGPDAFWDAAREVYGYEGPREPRQLNLYMLVSAALPGAAEGAFDGLPGNVAHGMAAYGWFVNWQREDREGLIEACLDAEALGGVERRLSGLERGALVKISVFPAADRLLLRETLRGFSDGRMDTDAAEILLRARRDMPWYSEYAAYYDAVRALKQAALFYRAHAGGFHYAEAEALWRDYEKNLCAMDGYYRAFCMAYDRALARGLIALEDELNAAADAMERLYRNWFLLEMGESWQALLAGHTLETALPSVSRQDWFYQNCVETADARVFVIISDGLRFEVGRELAARINGKLTGNAVCSALRAAIPTITPVGMAALLPHRRLELRDDMRLYCDGMPTEAGNREAVLRATCAESAAVGFKEFRQMGREGRKALARGMKAVYIYHDVIDLAGEGGGRVWDACEAAMDEILQMVSILVKELSAAQVLITADHGFLYTRLPLPEYEKADRDAVCGETLEYKRRYAVAREAQPDARLISMSLTMLGRPELFGVFPGVNMRFRVQGGSGGYVHGGLSPQEMMTPLLRYQNKKAGQKGFRAISKADVLLLGDGRKISNGIFSLNFYQQQPCTDKLRPRLALARFEDAAGEAVSDERTIICNSVSRENNDRVFRVTFHLLSGRYDRNADYYLVLKDTEDDAEMLREPFKIDIVFGLDFDF